MSIRRLLQKLKGFILRQPQIYILDGRIRMKKGKRFWRPKAAVFAAFLGGCLMFAGLPVFGAESEGPEAALIEMEDGEYAIEVELTGGTGKTTVSSPAGLTVLDGHAYARIEWSSSHYDYMLVDGKKYLPISEEGYSTFEIPITVFNEPMDVIADTTAMSTPHEISYQLTFDLEGVMSKSETPQAAAQKVVYMVFLIILVCIVVSWVNKRKRMGRR